MSKEKRDAWEKRLSEIPEREPTPWEAEAIARYEAKKKAGTLKFTEPFDPNDDDEIEEKATCAKNAQVKMLWGGGGNK